MKRKGLFLVCFAMLMAAGLPLNVRVVNGQSCEQKYADNCVLFIRECRGVPLPRPLETWAQKKRIVNDAVARIGSVAVIEIPSGKFKDYGHVALIKDVAYDRNGRATSILVEEANYPTPGVRTRRGNPDSMRVVGYFNPRR